MFAKRCLISTLHAVRRIYFARTPINIAKRPAFADRTTVSIQIVNMSSGDTRLVTYDEIWALRDNKSVLVIDVREPEELKETGVIPGSINIPLNDLENTLNVTPAEKFHGKFNRDKPDFTTPLVFSCKAGIRSEKAQNIALKLGYSNVRNYKGGWLDWEKHLKKS